MGRPPVREGGVEVAEGRSDLLCDPGLSDGDGVRRRDAGGGLAGQGVQGPVQLPPPGAGELRIDGEGSPGFTGAPGSRVVSSARHIASPDASRHATPASHRGIAMPSSAAAASVPFHPWPSTRAKGRRSNRTQVPRSVRAPTERRLRTTFPRSNRTSKDRSTRSSTSSTGSARRSTAEGEEAIATMCHVEARSGLGSRGGVRLTCPATDGASNELLEQPRRSGRAVRFSRHRACPRATTAEPTTERALALNRPTLIRHGPPDTGSPTGRAPSAPPCMRCWQQATADAQSSVSSA